MQLNLTFNLLFKKKYTVYKQTVFFLDKQFFHILECTNQKNFFLNIFYKYFEYKQKIIFLNQCYYNIIKQK